MLSLIPLPYKILALLALIAGVFFYGYTHGSSKADLRITNLVAERNRLATDLERKNASITNTIVTQYVDRVNVIREKEYVYRDLAQNSVPSQFVMSNGWVYSHDASATGGDADATRASDATSSGIADTQALDGIIRNYAICQSNAVQLTELQRWITENQAAINSVNAEEEKN
jgi:hypothetical protein